MEMFRINFIGFFRSFFPFQLVFSHLKYNTVGVLAWLIFFFIITDNLGTQFGLPILFYSPEYLGETSFWSFGILGFGFGGLMMAFNTYSYSKLGKRFPFLVFIKRPFIRFCKNNSIIPLIFFAVYLYNMVKYQWVEEYASSWTILYYSFSFVFGIILFVALSFIYFFPFSNRLKRFGLEVDEDSGYSFQTDYTEKKGKWYSRIFAKTEQRYLYFGKSFKINLSRPISHIDDSVVQKVLVRNRINTALFEILTFIFFISVSLLADRSYFEIPAALSVVLLVTLHFMVYSMLQKWFRKWILFIIVIAILLMNSFSKNTDYFSFKNYAYGLDYNSTKKPHYSIENIEYNATKDKDKESSPSYQNYISILEKWKESTGEEKPKLIIVNSSGGGLRSTLWTFEILQKLDQSFNGEFKKKIHLYTGASGGMVGASYFRELCLREKKGEITNIYSNQYFNQMGKDMLNRLAFSASTRDMFLRVQKFKYGGYSYPRDRGYAFEEQLHANTKHKMDHTLGYYTSYEKNADIPLMIITPTIVNDGRRMIISAQSLSFLTTPSTYGGIYSKTNENIDYMSFFKDINPQNIRFSSVLRSSSTFPFVTPMVTLPTIPEVQLMDAGIRDNYGVKITMEVLFNINNWIKENTSGVIILKLRDTKEILENTVYHQVSLINKLTLPFGNMYSNFPRTQDFDQDQLLKMGSKSFDFPFDIVSFNLRENVNDKISLSWHLSLQEKNKIKKAFYSSSNQKSYERLKVLLKKK